MEDQKNPFAPERTKQRDVYRTEKNEKFTYIVPTMGLILVELENNIAAGSIVVKETDEIIEESWMVEDEVVRDIDIDLF